MRSRALAFVQDVKRSRVAAASVSYMVSAIAPMVAALFSIPLTLRYLGAASFGLLTLYWAILTFLTNFDFGISQTLTKVLSAGSTPTINDEETKFAFAAYVFQLGIGIALAIAFLAATFLLNATRRDLIWTDHKLTLFLFLVTVPLLSLTVGFRATLEAKTDFQFVARVSLFSGLTQFLVPLALCWLGFGLDAIIAATLILRAGVLLAMWIRVVSKFELRIHSLRLSRRVAASLWSIGSWIALSNVVGPLILYLDRFLLPFFFPLSAIVAYSLPLELLLRTMIFPAIVNRVVFPFLNRESSAPRAGNAVYRKMALLMSAFGAAFLLGALLAPLAMKLWLGHEVGQESGKIAQIIMIALSFSPATYLAVNMLISKNSVSFEPKVQLTIFPFFLGALIFAMYRHSLIEVAVALCLRVAAHCLILLRQVRRVTVGEGGVTQAQIAFHFAAAVLVSLFVVLRT